MSTPLGILGVGHLASYVVKGLRRAEDLRQIKLSPRSKEVARYLYDDFTCHIAKNNQAVVDQSTLILLSVRPQHVDELLNSLQFNDQHIVVSCVAGRSINSLKALVEPATVVRTLPLASSEIGAGAVPLYPFSQPAADLLSQLGQLITLNNEKEFELASVAACMNGWIFDLLDTQVKWYEQQGLASDIARQWVIQSMQGATALAEFSPMTLSEIRDSIATEGTFTKLGLDHLNQHNALTLWNDASDKIAAQLLDTDKSSR